MTGRTWKDLSQGLPQPDLSDWERTEAIRNQMRVNANLWKHIHELEGKSAAYDRITKIIEEEI